MKPFFINNFLVKTVTFISSMVIALCALAPTVSLAYSAADAPYIPLAPIPGTVQDGCDFTDPKAECKTDFIFYLNGAYKTAIGVAGLLAVVMIIWWGFQYVLTSKEGGKSDSREGITNAIVGLLLTLGSWLIVYTINPKLVQLDFKIDKAADYKPVDLQKAFEEEIAAYQKTNVEIAKDQAKLKADIAAKEAQLQNVKTENDDQAAAAINKEVQELKVAQAKLNLADAINNTAESVAFNTKMLSKNTEPISQRLAMAKSALKRMDNVFNAGIKALEENGAADAIPEQRALYEAKRREFADAIEHRERCPTGDTIIMDAGEAQPLEVPCK